ncbi:MAG: bacterioferritin [Bdellovibrionota bacterium]
MKGNPEVIQMLNKTLTAELTAINQYFLHSRMAKDWGYEKIAKKIWDESIEEMHHAQNLTDRILFLEGLPNLQKLNSLTIGENIEEIFAADLKLEMTSHVDLKEHISFCHSVGDHGSRELFEKILHDEEEHIDWLESQLNIIKEISLPRYLAEQM